MQTTVGYTGANHRVSPATIELLIQERNRGKSLRQLGQMIGRSHEWVRQLLARYSQPQVTLLPKKIVAAKLGYPVQWLLKLRREGVIKPIMTGWYWLYSEEQIRQIPSLIAERRRCERCGKPRPLQSQKFCRECSQYRKRHRYESQSPEAKAKGIQVGMPTGRENSG